MKISGYILLIILALQACKHSQHRDQTLPEITINSFSEEAIPFSTLFDSLKYVTLKETEENFFGYITKLVANQQHLVFYDGMSNQIFIYDYEGRCQAKIHNQGRGEGEYIQITDLALDNEKQLIAVLDTWGKKVLYYDFKGQYISSQNIPAQLMPNSFFLTKDKICFINGNQWKLNPDNSNFLNVCTRDGLHPLYSAYPVTPAIQSLKMYGEFQNTLCQFQDKLFSISATDCTIAQIADTLQPVYSLTLTDLLPLEKLKKLEKKNLDQKFWKERYLYNLSNLLVDNNFIYFVCNGQYNVIYNPHNGHSYSWKNISYNNSNTSRTFIAQSGNWLICQMGKTAFGLNPEDINQTEEQRTLLFLRLREDL